MKPRFSCTDARLDFIEVECWPIKDRDASVAISIRDADDRMAIAAWLTRADARGLAKMLNTAAEVAA